MDSQLEVSLKEAMTINPAYEIGDKIRFEVTPKDFGRIAAQTAKQVILQRCARQNGQSSTMNSVPMKRYPARDR